MLGVSVWLLATAVAADPAPVDPVAAGRLEFEVANKEFNLGNFDKALAHFEAAYRLSSRPQLLYNIGFVEKQLFERTHHLDSLHRAIERFKSYLAIVPSSSDPAVAASRKRTEDQLKDAEDELVREESARAEGEEALTVGEELAARGKLAEAEAQVDKYRRRAGNERPGVVRARLLEGTLLAARGDVAAAAEAYAAALSLDRAAAISRDASAAALQAFSMAQLRIGPGSALSVVHAPPASVKLNAPLELRFAITGDPLHLAKTLALHYRSGGGAFTNLPPTVISGDAAVVLPRVFTGSLLPGSRVEYYGEVLDADGARLEHLGSEATAFRVEVKTAPVSVTKRWWFWTATVGGVAVATGVALGLVFGLNRPLPSTDVAVKTLTVH